MAIPFLNGIDVTGTVDLSNLTIDGAQGTDGQVLTSTGSGIAWEDVAGGSASLSGGEANKVAVWSATDTLTHNDNFHFDTTNVRLGIGTQSPSHKLHVHSGADNDYIARFEGSTNNGAGVWTGIGIGGESNNTKSAIIFEDIGVNYSRGKLHLAVNNEQNQNNATKADAKLTVNNDGNVGIGETDPNRPLVVSETRYGSTASDAYTAVIKSVQTSGASPNPGTGGLKVQYTSSSSNVHAFGLVAGSSSSDFLTTGPMHWYTNSDLDTVSATGFAMTIDTSQRVGIGLTNPSAKLEVAGTDGNFKTTGHQIFLTKNGLNEIYAQSGASPALSSLAFGTNSAERMRISSTGQVGIATTNPLHSLQVGNATGTRSIQVSSASESALYLTTPNSTAQSVIGFGANQFATINTRGRILYQSSTTPAANYMQFNVAFNEIMRLTNSNVGIGTTNPSEKLHVSGNILATSFKKSGGTSSQFLKADGSVDSNTYLTAHPNISGATSQNNTGNGFIQDLTFDSNGHVTGVVSASVSGFASSSHTHAASDITSGTLAAARLPEFIEEKYIFTSNDSNAVYMPMVKGGMYATSSSSITGQILIKVPSYKSNMMMQFYVDIYDYETGESLTFKISGYNNNDTNATWYNCSVVNLSDDTDRDYTVRFGADTSLPPFQYVTIGETNSVWSYPQINVRDFYGGYATSEGDAQGSFDVSFVTTTPGSVSRTHTGNFVAGDYNNLKNTPTIPTNNNQLTNGAGYITSSGVAAKIKAGGTGPSTENLNTVADSVSTGQLEYRGFNASSTNKPATSDNANGVITVGQHSGNYSAQLAFSSNGNVYWRDNPAGNHGSWRKMWDEGNDGSGTGLDADLLDGFQTTSGANRWGVVPTISGSGVLEAGKYIDFHESDTANVDYNYRITSASGKLHFSGDIEVDGGDIYINDTNTRITEGVTNSLRAQTNSGYIDIGPQNTSHCHIRTDRSNFYFDKELQVNTGVVRSYDEDLNLNRAGSTTARLRITSGTTISDQNLTVDAGTSTTLSVKCNDSGVALIRANGDNQGTGALEVGQSDSYGGGISYNGDNSPAFASGESADHITFYRMSGGNRTEVFSYPYSGNTVTFNGAIKIGGTGSANELDDYEEGTYNIRFYHSGTNYTFNSSNFGTISNNSKYVKVGRMVTIYLRVEFDQHPSAWASSSSSIYLNNLPFTPVAGTIQGGCAFDWLWATDVPLYSSSNSYARPNDYGAEELRQHHQNTNGLVYFHKATISYGYYTGYSTGSMSANDFPSGNPGGVNYLMGSFTYYTND